MADKEITDGAQPVAPSSASAKEQDLSYNVSDAAVDGPTSLPSGWMYRERQIGKFSIPWYASPKVQLGMVAFVCFLCPGMFNALGGMGGGGRADPTLGDNMVSWPRCSTPYNKKTNLTDLVEHGSVQYLRGLWILRWNFRQQTRCEADLGIWGNRILHLCYQSVGLGTCPC
jgi:hypothetical protein